MRNDIQSEALSGTAQQPAPASLFLHRDFMKLWTGETVSLFGSRIGSVAVTFAAVITLRATPFQMGLLAAVGNLPALAFSLLAGAWVDRLSRRPIMIATDIGRSLVLVTIPIAALYGLLGMRQLYVVMLLSALFELFFDVAYRAYLPTLVDREQLLDANSKLSASSAVAEFAGFSICGWLVQWLTAPFAILIDAISFLPSAVAIAAIRTPEPTSTARRERALSREIAEGLKLIWSDDRLRAIAVVETIGGLFFSLWNTLYMLFVVNSLGFKPAALGMIFAVGGISSLFGALVARRSADAMGVVGAMILGLVVAGFAMMLLPIAHGSGALSIGLLVAQQLIGDGALTIYLINSVSWIQVIAPHHLLGRVTASLRFLNRSSTLVGQLVGGVAGGIIGLRPTMVIGAVGLWITAALLRAARIDVAPDVVPDIAVAKAVDQ